MVLNKIVHWLDWHAALLATAVFGAATLGFIALKLDETVPQRNPRATEPAQVLANWGRLLRHPTFRAWTALLCLSYGGIFFVLAGSSFVFIDRLGLSRVGYGLVLSTLSLAYIGGTLLCRRLLLRHGLRGAARRGAWFSLAGALGIGAASLAGVESVWAIIVPQWLFAIGHGVNQPCGQAGVVGPFPEKAGTAASLSGFAMMATAFAVSLWLGHMLVHSVLAMTLGVSVFGIALAGVAWTLVQRDGDPAAAWQPPAGAAPVRCS